jgi:hypothetical protein
MPPWKCLMSAAQNSWHSEACLRKNALFFSEESSKKTLAAPKNFFGQQLQDQQVIYIHGIGGFRYHSELQNFEKMLDKQKIICYN